MSARMSTVDQEMAELVKAFHTMDGQGKTFILQMATSQAARWPTRPKPLLTLVHSLPTVPVSARYSE